MTSPHRLFSPPTAACAEQTKGSTRLPASERSINRERGGTMAEAALALSVFFVLLLAILWFGLAFSAYQSTVNAAREGARYGVAPNAAGAYQLPTANQVAQRTCSYLNGSVLGKGGPCASYGVSTPPSISDCSDPALTNSDNIYVGTMQVPYNVAWTGGGGTVLMQQEVIVGIRRTVPVMGLNLHLTTCSAMRSENN